MQTRIGCKALAKSPNVHMGELEPAEVYMRMAESVGRGACLGVWTGSGDVSKEDSLWSELEDLEPGDAGPYELAA